jgi:hypothetical protein
MRCLAVSDTLMHGPVLEGHSMCVTTGNNAYWGLPNPDVQGELLTNPASQGGAVYVSVRD